MHKNTLHPNDLTPYLTAKARVEAIARLKYGTTINALLAREDIRQFLAGQGVQAATSRIMRSQLEAEHWEALAQHLQRKSVQRQILGPLEAAS